MHVLTTVASSSAVTAAPCSAAAVTAHSVAEASFATLPKLRQTVGPVNGQPLSHGFIKHMDDQTVVGLAAVFQAIHAAGLDIRELIGWGIVAAPRFLGRSTLATALPKFIAEGAWGVSPHTIPYFSLHSVAGAVSHALKIQGPNFGVGGGPDGEAEALLAGLALLNTQQLPGVWVVVTGWDPELVPLRTESIGPPPVCRAAALALTPVQARAAGLRLRMVPATRDRLTPSGRRGVAPPSVVGRLDSLVAVLGDRCRTATVHWPLPGGSLLEWRWTGDKGTREVEHTANCAEILS